MERTLQEINEERAKLSAQQLIMMGGIPVLCLGVHLETHELIIIGYHQLDRPEIAAMLTDFLSSVNEPGSRFYPVTVDN